MRDLDREITALNRRRPDAANVAGVCRVDWITPAFAEYSQSLSKSGLKGLEIGTSGPGYLWPPRQLDPGQQLAHDVGELWMGLTGSPASLRLEARELDHLAPLLGFVGDELAEVGGRAGKYRTAQSASRALILGSAKPALISLLSLSMISAGVFLGAPTPYQRSPRSPARNRPRSECPAAPPSAQRSLPRAVAACRP